MSMCLHKWLEAGSDMADALQILINGTYRAPAEQDGICTRNSEIFADFLHC